MTEEFGIRLEKLKAAKAEAEKPVEEPRVAKAVEEEASWEAKLKVASAKAIAREFKRRGWETVADIEANFQEAKRVFVQMNVQNLIALFKEDK